MKEKLSGYFKDFEFNESSETSIAEVNGVKLPNDYLQFLGEYNGGEGSVGNEGYLQLWSFEKLTELNDFYETRQKLPRCALIGTDLSGSKFGVTVGGEFFSIPDDMDLNKDEIKILCGSFEKFIEIVGCGDYI